MEIKRKLTLRRGSRPAHSSLSKNPNPGTLMVSSTVSLRTLIMVLPTLSPIMLLPLLHRVQLKMPSAILASGHGNRRSEKWSVSSGLVLPHSQSSIFSGKRKTVSEQKCKPLASLHKIVIRKSKKTNIEYLGEKNALKVPIFCF